MRSSSDSFAFNFSFFELAFELHHQFSKIEIRICQIGGAAASKAKSAQAKDEKQSSKDVTVGPTPARTVFSSLFSDAHFGIFYVSTMFRLYEVEVKIVF